MCCAIVAYLRYKAAAYFARQHLRMRSLVRVRCEGVALWWGMVVTAGTSTEYTLNQLFEEHYSPVAKVASIRTIFETVLREFECIWVDFNKALILSKSGIKADVTSIPLASRPLYFGSSAHVVFAPNPHSPSSR
jgi:hypothetical protein